MTQRTRSPDAEVFQLALLFLGQTRFGLAEIGDQILAFHALDGCN